MKAEKSTPSTPAPPDKDSLPRVLSRVPRPEPHEWARIRNCGGAYRVIHGQIIVGRPREETHNTDGTRKENEPLQEYLRPGDCVHLNDFDAAFALDNNIVEPIDIAVSRVGRVFKDAVEALSDSSRRRLPRHLTGRN